MTPLTDERIKLLDEVDFDWTGTQSGAEKTKSSGASAESVNPENDGKQVGDTEGNGHDVSSETAQVVCSKEDDGEAVTAELVQV